MWLSMAFPFKNDLSGILLVFIELLSAKEVKELSTRGCESSARHLGAVPNSKTFLGTCIGRQPSPFPSNRVL